MIFVSASITYTVHLVTTIICYLVASCRSFVAFLEDIKNDVTFLNVGGTSDYSQVMLKQRLCNIIQLYSDVKQLSLIQLSIKYENIHFAFYPVDSLTIST